MDRTHRSSPEGSQDSDLPAPRQWNRASAKSRAPGQAERWQKCLLAVLQQAHQYYGGPQADSGWNEQTALAPPRISTAGTQRRRDPRSVHLGSINSNNWLPLLAFRKRLMAGEVAPKPSTASVASVAEASETATVRSIRNMACRRSARRRSSRSSTWPAIGIIDGGSEKQRDLLMDF